MRVTAYLIAPESNTFVAGTRSRGDSAIQGFAKKSGGKGRSQARKAKSLAGNNKTGMRLFAERLSRRQQTAVADQAHQLAEPNINRDHVHVLSSLALSFGLPRA